MFEHMGSLERDEAYNGHGVHGGEEVQQLVKALQAQENTTDIANLQDVGALQVQSLEGTLAMLTFSEKSLTLVNDVPKSQAFQTLEEYSVQTGYGQEGGWTGQMETPVEGDASAQRQFAQVRFLRTLWKISDVAGIVGTIRDAEVWQKQAASMRLLRNLNATLYSGDSSLISESIDGFEVQIRNNGSEDHVKDLRGGTPTQQDFRELAELVAANYGNPDGAALYCSPGGMTTLDQTLENVGGNTAQRFLQGTVGNDGGMSMGFGIKQIHTSFGTIIPKTDIHLAAQYEGRGVPKKPDPNNPSQTIEGKTSVRAPNTPTVAVSTLGATAGSKWNDADPVRPSSATPGKYQFRVAAGNRFGLSAASAAAVTGGAAVATGEALRVAITPDSNSTYGASYFEIYSEQVAQSGDFKLVGRIAASGSSTVNFDDLNTRIPGTTTMFLLDLTSVGDMRTFTLSRLAPLHSKEYARIGEYRWGSVNMYVAPKYYAPLRYTMLENVAIGVQSKNNLIEV